MLCAGCAPQSGSCIVAYAHAPREPLSSPLKPLQPSSSHMPHLTEGAPESPLQAATNHETILYSQRPHSQDPNKDSIVPRVG